MPIQLERAKSASSLQPPLFEARSFILSAEAQQEAVTAAELAFERSQQRVLGHKDAQGAQDAGRTSAAAAPVSETDLQRSQSIRFAGPNAVKTKKIDITRREAPKDHHAPDFEYRNANPYKRHDRDYALTLIQQEQDAEFVEPYIASEPSSYRKLRKAKSMFTVGKTTSGLSSRVTDTSGGHFKRRTTHTEDLDPGRPKHSYPRLHRSLSFLRGVSDGLPSDYRQQALNDEAVQLARDHYLYDLNQQRLKKQPSFLKLSKRRKSNVELHKRFCHDSGVKSRSIMTAETTDNGWIGQKARSASETLRKAMNKVFSRHSKLSIMPVQHLDSQKAHYRDNLGDNDLAKGYAPVPSPDIDLLRRVASRETPAKDVAASILPLARRGSLSCADGDGDISARHSRVSSWTDSTTADNTHLSHLLERKRLSIIREDEGPHQPSSSVDQYMGAADSYAAFRQPIRLVSPYEPAPAQRVYSALQKEIRRSGQRLDLDSNEDLSDDSFDRTSSQHYHKLQQDERIDSIAKYSNEPYSQDLDSLFTRTMPVDTSILTSHRVTEGNGQLTPRSVADPHEIDLPAHKGPLRETKSAFFPSDVRYDRMTPSPYRRAKKEHSSELHEQSRTNDGSPRLSPLKVKQQGEKHCAALSESVYSRTSGGHSPLATDTPLSRGLSDDVEVAGTAIILSSRPSTATNIPWQPRQGRLASDTSSRRWTKWMNSEVLSLDDSQPVHSDPYEMQTATHPTHRRECAQKDKDEFGTLRSKIKYGTDKQPLGITQSNPDPRSLSRKDISSTDWERSDSPEWAETTKAAKVARLKENNPAGIPQPLSIMLPNSGDMENISKAASHSRAVKSHMISQVSMSPQPNGNSNSTSTHSRHGPERAERLRRLKSKSSQSLRRTYGISSSSGHETQCLASATVTPSFIMSTPNDCSPDALVQSRSFDSKKKDTNQILLEKGLRAQREEVPTDEGGGGDVAFI